MNSPKNLVIFTVRYLIYFYPNGIYTEPPETNDKKKIQIHSSENYVSYYI